MPFDSETSLYTPETNSSVEQAASSFTPTRNTKITSRSLNAVTSATVRVKVNQAN